MQFLGCGWSPSEGATGGVVVRGLQWVGQFGGGVMSLLGRSLFCAVFVQQVHGLQGGDLGEDYDRVVQGSEICICICIYLLN